MKDLNADMTEETKILPKQIVTPVAKEKYVSVFKVQMAMMEGIEYLWLLLAILGSIGLGCLIPINDNLLLLSYDAIMIYDDPINLRRENDVWMTLLMWTTALVFFSAALMATFWTYNGKKVADRYKMEYFKLIMQNEQCWFDRMKPLELANKILVELDVIERGVNFILYNFRSDLSVEISYRSM